MRHQARVEEETREAAHPRSRYRRPRARGRSHAGRGAGARAGAGRAIGRLHGHGAQQAPHGEAASLGEGEEPAGSGRAGLAVGADGGCARHGAESARAAGDAAASRLLARGRRRGLGGGLRGPRGRNGRGLRGHHRLARRIRADPEKPRGPCACRCAAYGRRLRHDRRHRDARAPHGRRLTRGPRSDRGPGPPGADRHATLHLRRRARLRRGSARGPDAARARFRRRGRRDRPGPGHLAIRARVERRARRRPDSDHGGRSGQLSPGPRG